LILEAPAFHEGSNALHVCVTDYATSPPANQAACADRTIIRDTTPPDTTLTGGPGAQGNSSYTNSPNVSFAFTATEAGSTFKCSLDNAVFSTCASGQAYNSLADGSHTFQVYATDAVLPVGNANASPATAGFVVD